MNETTQSNFSNDLTELGFLNTLQKTKGQMNFVGIMAIIFGAISCLSIFGAIVGIPLILAGLRAKDSAEKLGHFLENKEIGDLKNAITLVGKYFEMKKLFYIISLILTVLTIIFYIVILVTFGGMIFDQMNSSY